MIKFEITRKYRSFKVCDQIGGRGRQIGAWIRLIWKNEKVLKFKICNSYQNCIGTVLIEKCQTISFPASIVIPLLIRTNQTIKSPKIIFPLKITIALHIFYTLLPLTRLFKPKFTAHQKMTNSNFLTKFGFYF